MVTYEYTFVTNFYKPTESRSKGTWVQVYKCEQIQPDIIERTFVQEFSHPSGDIEALRAEVLAWIRKQIKESDADAQKRVAPNSTYGNEV